MIFFTADQHFGHTNIIKYCGRPFVDAEEMEEKLIINWNNVVTEQDTVYILGDFSLATKKYKDQLIKICGNLPGTKHLIVGNHDQLHFKDYLDIGFTTVHTALQLFLPVENEESVIKVNLAHDPAISITDRRAFWLVGHIHNLYRQVNNTFNVGVDVNNYTPVSWESIRNLVLKFYDEQDNYYGNNKKISGRRLIG